MKIETIRDFILAEILEDESVTLGDDEDLLLSEVLDSLSVTRLIGYLEAETGLEIPPEDVTLEHFQTLRCIGDYLAGRRVAAGASAGG